MPVSSAVAISASSGTPSDGSMSATISQVAAAPGSIQFAAPNPVFETWWSTLAMVARDSHSPCSAATRPVRFRSPVSTITARSGSRPGVSRTCSIRGSTARKGGGGSPLTTSDCLPSRSAAMAMAIAAPRVSPSGFS